MRLARLSKSNIRIMIRIASGCFDKKYVEKEVRKWYDKRIDGSYREINPVLEYFLIVEKNEPIGITGFFNFADDPDFFWLAYFGVIKQERNKGVGSEILRRTILASEKYGCRNFGVWTSSKKAGVFYEKNEFIKGRSKKTIVVNGKIIYRYPKGTVFFYRNA